jgi:nitrite reductase/ring-hydroxylating ferredoxin subunit
MLQKITILKSQIVLGTLALLITSSCSKNQNSFVPYTTVDFYIPLATNNHLTIPGNSITYRNQGYGGIIVMCINPTQYYAFDACCPYEALSTCTAELDPIKGLSNSLMVYSSSVVGKCKCCGSEFSLFGGGYPTKGPASRPLQQYQVEVIGGRLWVHN